MSKTSFFSRKPKVVAHGKVYKRRRMVRWGRMMRVSKFTLLTLAAVAVLTLVIGINRSDEVGDAGVVGKLAKGMTLNCGADEIYVPKQIGIFHPTLPCGAVVRMHANGRTMDVPVIGTTVPFKTGYARVADMTVGTAKALGLPEDGLHQASLRPMNGDWQVLKSLAPMVAGFQRGVKAERPLPFTAEERTHLTKNVLSEAEEYGVLAYVPVIQTTVNRLAVKYRGQMTLKGVIYDPWQFTWTMPKHKVDSSPKGTAAWTTAEAVVHAALTDRLSGDALAMQYLTQKCVIYYDAKYIKAPEWGRFKKGMTENKEFSLIELPNTLEVLTGARCLAPAPKTMYAKRLEMVLASR